MAVLVLQHPELTQLNWQAWADVLTPPTSPSSVWRLPVADGFALSADQDQFLAQHQVDAVIMPDVAFGDLGLIISDMDSTLLTIECMAGVGEVSSGKAWEAFLPRFAFELSKAKPNGAFEARLSVRLTR